MRSFAIIAVIFAVANADGHDTWNMDEAKMDDWNKDMDHSGHHDMDHDWNDIECMMSEWGCSSAVTLGATATALAATMAILM